MTDKIDTEKIRKYILKDPYIRKDGSISYVTRVKEYIPNGRGVGRPRTPESILIAEIRKLSDKEKEKVTKYVNKIKERREFEDDDS